MNHILYLPTRFFPSISGAEFYFQRMAEILITKYNYNIDIFTSNAIDFKALRNSSGRIINHNDKYFDHVNNLNINRFPVNYNTSAKDILNKLQTIPAYNKLNLNDVSLELFIKNGPYLGDLLEFLLNKPDMNYELIHSTFFPYFNCILSLIIGAFINKPKVCTPFFHWWCCQKAQPDRLYFIKLGRNKAT